jgi:general secretion pathway protein G
MAYDQHKGMRSRRRQRGVTLLELIAATVILMILMSAALPVVRLNLKRQKETQLRRDLWEMRAAIDRYKEVADSGVLQVKVGSENYPPDMETLVKGVDVQGRKLRFLRRVPIDPMTGKDDWGMHSVQDDPTSDSWGGQNLFDVYSKSQGKALDGTNYKDW